ncbi:MAG: hypothetical protein AAF525_16475, partial [Pseudomonadota bacterium]
EFLAITDLVDSGAMESSACTFGCNGVDYILYRSGAETSLDVVLQETVKPVPFVDVGNNPLSDHPPLIVTIEVSTLP